MNGMAGQERAAPADTQGRGWLWAGLVLLGGGLVPLARVASRFAGDDGWGDSFPNGVIVRGVQGGLFLAGALLLWRRPGRRALGRLALLATVTAIGLLAAEGVARLCLRSTLAVCGWRSRCTALEQNELGFRGHPIRYGQDDCVVVLLGDSLVESYACGYGWMPERRLEAHLRRRLPSRSFRVVSLGAGGYGQDQQWLALREYGERHRANLVVLWQTFENDVWNNVFPTHMPRNGTPKPTFRLVAGALAGPNHAPGAVLQVRSCVRLLDPVFNAWLGGRRLDDDWERLLPPPYQPRDIYDGPVCTNWQHRWDLDSLNMRNEDMGREKTHFSVYLSPRSPRLQYGLDLTRALLSAIEQETRRLGADFVILDAAAPDGLVDGDQVYVLQGRYYRASQAARDLNQRYVNAGFTTLRVPVTVTDYRMGPENGHLNEHAVDQVMDDLAAALCVREGFAVPAEGPDRPE